MTPMNTIVDLRTARARGERPGAPGANLKYANLRGADLQGANLQDTNLQYANLRGADLQDTDLRGSDLRGANLQDTKLRGANLWEANLHDTNLRGADLHYVNLQDAELWGANLQDTNLRGANLQGFELREEGIVYLGETPSGGALIFPTPGGWVMQVGCWRGSPDDLRALIAKDDGWPSATGNEIVRRRPYLEAILTHVDLITTEKSDLIAELAAKWRSAA